MINVLYIYKGDDITQEYLYLENLLMGFVKDLDYPRGGFPWDEASSKLPK